MFECPPFRKLRGYAFDPSLSLRIDTAFINSIVYKVPWEEHLEPGPSGEYLEVIDFDPTVDKFYKPVDLNNASILAQDGLEPTESNPQFHQQMVYAVAMTTIKNFEKALGRPILWSPRMEEKKDLVNKKTRLEAKYVPTLRIYPHAFRGANAYYSPQKKALLFGYFSAQPAEPTIQMPNSIIFTCLSHDIIAHETTHAILDGLYTHYTEDTNPDMVAFHEAFADMVALFQRFTFPEVLKHQIGSTRGDLAAQNLLGDLAQEFGWAIGNYGALRSAIGKYDEITEKWKPNEPSGNEYQMVTEPHERGTILVSAVFEAFLTIYKNRIADLLRLATEGTGVLREGQLHPDLVNRLAGEASKAAGHVLTMCIRALDYCPPVDITFGDYLRALITADLDLVTNDDRNYRLAFIDAFRRRGIYPTGINNLSAGSLCYPKAHADFLKKNIPDLYDFLREYAYKMTYVKERSEIFNITRDYIVGTSKDGHEVEGLILRLKNLKEKDELEKLTGLVFDGEWESLGIRTSNSFQKRGPSFAIQSLRVASRVGPSGNQRNEIIVALVQYAGIRVLNEDEADMDFVPFDPPYGAEMEENEFLLFGGITMIFDLDTMNLKYAISKPLLDLDAMRLNKRSRHLNTNRIRKQHAYLHSSERKLGLYEAHFSRGKTRLSAEPFSLVHNH